MELFGFKKACMIDSHLLLSLHLHSVKTVYQQCDNNVRTL
jgi:hypothetical protein